MSRNPSFLSVIIEIVLFKVLFFSCSSIYFCDGSEMIERCESTQSEATSKIYEETTESPITIAGGIDALPEQYPHIVALGYGSESSPSFFCGGTLISDEYVLTAAHCVVQNGSLPLKIVRLGTHKLSVVNVPDVSIADIKIHPEYRSPSSYNDIALLKLTNRVDFPPAILYNETELYQENLDAIGWGKTDFAGPDSDVLQEVTLQHMPGSRCKEIYKNSSKDKLPHGLLTNKQICAGGEIGKDSCPGDSGGPLGFQDENYHYIVGVTSFGKACAISGAPGVYTRVSAFVNWIESIIH